MSGVATAIAATAAVSYIASSNQADAATSAANTQANAAIQEQGNLLAAGQGASQQFTPYSSYGTTPLNSLIANNDYFNKQFSNQDLNANLAPNFAFGLDIGQRSNLMANNATGGVDSGNAQTALTQFSNNYAQNAYQNAFNNFQVQRGNISAIDLANANLGLSGATGSANAQLGTSTNIANLGIGSANAQAAGTIGAANAYSTGATNLSNIGLYAANMYGGNNAVAGTGQNLGSLNYQQPTIGGAPTGGYSNMGGSGYGMGGYSPQVQG
jgi:hypothetical protein